MAIDNFCSCGYIILACDNCVRQTSEYCMSRRLLCAGFKYLMCWDNEKNSGFCTSYGEMNKNGRKHMQKFILLLMSTLKMQWEGKTWIPTEYSWIFRWASLRIPFKVQSQVLNIFQAARESTALSIGNVFFHLDRYPLVWQITGGSSGHPQLPQLWAFQINEVLVMRAQRKFVMNILISILKLIVLNRYAAVCSYRAVPKYLCFAGYSSSQWWFWWNKSYSCTKRWYGHDQLPFYASWQATLGQDAEAFFLERWMSVRPKWEY